MKLLGVNGDDDDTSESDFSLDSEYDSSSDASFRSFSPVSSEDEYSSLSSDESDQETDEGDLSSTSTNPTEEDSSSPTSTTQKVVNTFKLVGDNVDSMFKQRYMRSDKHRAGGIHYFHTYAARDRIDFSMLSERFPEPNSLPREEDVALSLLPSNKDDKAIRKHFAILLSQELVKNVPFFKSTFDGAVTWHIKHQFYDEMSSKSEVVSSLKINSSIQFAKKLPKRSSVQ